MTPYDPRKKKRETNYFCSYCDIAFKDIGKLLEHEEDHEKKIEATEQTRNIPYQQS